MRNRPATEWYRESIGTIVEERAQDTPDDVFCIYGPTDERVTYAELDSTTNRIGNALLTLGLEPGDRVSIMSEDSLRTLYLMYACSKAGLVYCPINFNYKGIPLVYQLNDTRPDLLVVDDEMLSVVDDVGDSLEEPVRYIQLDAGTDGPSVREESECDSALRREGTFADLLDGDQTPVPVQPSWHDTAWIIYTSGTTGNPKGVALPHRWIVANHAGYASLLHDDGEVVHSTLPFYHIGGASFEITATLLSGSTVVMWDKFSTEKFVPRIREYGATSALLAGVMVPWLLEEHDEQEHVETPLEKIHIQPLVENYDAFTDRFGVDFVSVAFGQTETGLPISGLIDMRAGGSTGGRSPDLLQRMEQTDVPVVSAPPEERFMGRPRSDIVQTSIVGDDDEHLNPYEVGELVVRPNKPFTLLQEYINSPAKTLDEVTNLWFHTGDYVYRDDEDNYYFVDRDSSVIRRRGENISSKRIQDITNELDRVSHTAAFPVPAAEGGEDEVGIAVVLADGSTATEVELRNALSERMPNYMVPSTIFFVDEIPQTPTNKMKKEELRRELLDL